MPANELAADLERLRWPDGFRCPRCGGSIGWKVKRGLWKCPRCRRQTSLTAGTIFAGTRTSLEQWVAALRLVVATPQRVRFVQGVSARRLMDALNLHSYQTAWGMLYKVRRVLAEESKQHLLKEPVTVHALHIGGRPGLPLGNLSRRRTAVLVAVETRRGNWIPHVQLRSVTRVTSATVLRFMKEVVQPSKAPNHETVAGANARTAAKAAETAAIAATVVSQFRARAQPDEQLDSGVSQMLTVLRGWWGRTHNNGVGTWQIDDALGEFAWYFNTRRVRLRGRLLEQLLRRSVITLPGTVNSLAGPPKGVPRSRRPKAISQRRSASAKRLKPRSVKTFVTVEDAIEL